MASVSTAEMIRAAVDAARSGRADEALRHWRQIAEREEHPVALNALGSACLATGDAAQASALFARAVRADPDVGALHFNLASAHRQLGDDDGEKTALEAGLAIEALDLAGNIRLAELLERRGEAGASARWSAVLGIMSQMPSVPDHLRDVADHASAYIRGQSEALAGHVDAELVRYRDPTIARAAYRAQAAIDYTLGRRRIYLNQCAGLHVPFLPAEEYFERVHFPWLDSLESATAAIRDELLAVLAADNAGFEPYVDLPAGAGDTVWNKLNRSKAWSAFHLWRHGRRIEAACSRFPRTAAVIEQLPLAAIPNRTPTVYFSVLAAHTTIPPHTGVSNARAIIHLPLVVPPGCHFRVGGETRSWQEGVALAFDDTIEHEAWNESDEPRVVLILDTWNPHLTEFEREMLTAFYAASETSSQAPSWADRLRMG